MEIKTTEFFYNIKKLPPPGTNEFKQLIDWEIQKSLGGVKVNGVYISGWLYFHLNHWWIRIDAKDNYGNIIRKPSLPKLRDNEWIRAEMLEECKKLKKGYLEIGLRQGGKSEFESSFTGYNATLFEQTQNLVVGGNDADLSLIKDKLDFGLKNLWEGIRIPRLDKDWKKPIVRLGYKDKNGEDNVFSYILIRNANGGDNTEAPAGTTAKSFIMDEIGKYLFGQTFEAAKPSFLSEYGWRTIPILVGTGGAFEKGDDAERYFYNPDANNFISILDEETNIKTGLFMSGLYRQDCKVDKTLFEWLVETKRISPEQKHNELDKIIIKVSDKDLALKKINEEREEKRKDPDQNEYLKVMMYHPLTPTECFLSIRNNIFPTELCKKQKERLLAEEKTGVPVELFHDGTKICHKFVDKKPICTFPLKNGESKDAPIVIYEFPMENPPYGLYVAGVDPYRQGNSAYSDSLGSVYIVKRMHDIQSEKYQDMIVASYTARPDNKDEWEEQARLLIKYYNARTLVENDDISFIEYMKAQGDAYYLEKQPPWLREIVPNSSVTREYGIHRSSDKIRNHLHSVYARYLREKLIVEKDENGSVIREVLGVVRILDPMLLEETIKFNEDSGNYDRLIAAELAFVLSHHLNSIFTVSSEEDEIVKSIYNRKRSTRTFSQLKNKIKL
jgi:hypothetical protein